MYQMNKELLKSADACYRRLEQKAADYFKLLSVQYAQKHFVSTLTKDFDSWKQNHTRSFLQRKGKQYEKGYNHYIQYLNTIGRLDRYLDRSISYIFMRDLGKALDSPDTKASIQRFVHSLKKHLIASTASQQERKIGIFNLADLYRWAQREGIQSTFDWVVNKLKIVSFHIPKGMDAEHAKRKLIKIIAGVVLHVIEKMDDEISPEERTRKLDKAIRLGYSYGLTYPFIDDLLDSEVLTVKEKRQYSDLIRTTLISGSVPELGEWTGENKELIRFIHSELREAFEYIKVHQREETRERFFEQSYVLFHSQEVDRLKDLCNPNYTNEELYIPIILKSSSSRLVARSVISAQMDEGFENRTFFYGIYNQLADDFADMFDDLKKGAVTPYTYYFKYHNQRSDLINPFELYWTVISNLIHQVYQSDPSACEVILDRAINGLKRFKERMGKARYNEVMELFTFGNSKFNRVIQKMVRKADDVDFFDKLLRDHMIDTLRNDRKEQEVFFDTIRLVRQEINNILSIPSVDDDAPIINAANYSLKGDGKRLRPIIAWVIGVNEYGLKSSAIVPLVKSLEYMHTASLIFDDLPSEDNASFRRGRKTLHQVYSVATAELTGLFLTQRATRELTSLDQFGSKTVLKLIHYASQRIEDMCMGQVMDLDSKGKRLTVEQLNTMSFYKTGLAFEASLMMPAILAQKSEHEMEVLKKIAYHAGIAFQIKDDLLDVEGDEILLGKSIGKDAENNNSTFVSILGSDGAKKAMWEHYCLAVEAIQELPQDIIFLKHLLNYMVNRDR